MAILFLSYNGIFTAKILKNKNCIIALFIIKEPKSPDLFIALEKSNFTSVPQFYPYIFL